MKQKITLIRRLTIGLVFSGIIMCYCSCAYDYPSSTTQITIEVFYYYNPTSHHLSITSFNSGKDSTYYMFPGDTLIVGKDLPVGAIYNNFRIANADSVSLIFNYSRILKYTFADTSHRNIIQPANYNYAYKEDDFGDYYAMFHLFLFTFTENDYANSLPIHQNP